MGYRGPADRGPVYHWLMQPPGPGKFLMEVRRVLRPGTGRLAVLGYGVCSIVSHMDLEGLFKAYYYDTLGSGKGPGQAGCWWDIDRRILDGALDGADFGPHLEVIRKEIVIDRRRMPLSTFLDYLASFSAYQTLKRSLEPGQEDPLEQLQARLVHGAGGDINTEIEADYPYFVI